MRRRTLRSAVLATVSGAVLVLPAAVHAQSIDSASGPLTHIDVSPDLNCAVNHTGDTAGEFFADTACGTLLASGGVLYGPANIPAGGSAAPRTTWTPVSQSATTGSGTTADPYKVVTVVDAGTSGLRVTETDTYVVGEEAYRTDVQVTNTGAAAAPVILYRAGDCYLQNSDTGFGKTYGTTGAIACLAADVNDPTQKGTRVEQWFPLTAGSHYYEDYYSAVWAKIGSQTEFADVCALCDTNDDNGAGLSWAFTVPAGQSVTQSHLTSFSPTGVVPLTTAKTADTASAAAGGSDGYTITISNPGASDVPLTSVTDTLPAGFTYTTGSTTGATTANPSGSTGTITWSLSNVTVPHGQSVSLHFTVGVGCTAGTFYNDAGGTATGTSVAPVTHTAPVTVSGTCGGPVPDTTSLSASSASTQYSDPMTMTATLTDTTTGAPLAGAPVSFTFGGASYSATTNGSGVASATVPQVLLVPGASTFGVSYLGDATHSASSGTGAVTVTKEDCTLAYTGDLQTPAGGTSALRAVLGEPDSTLGDRSAKTVDFLITGSGGAAAGDPTAVTDGTGTAATTVTLPADVYSVQPRFGGDAYYLPCSSSGNDLLTVGSSTAKVTGGGFLTSGGRTSFGFNAGPGDAGGYAGQLQVRAPGRHRFHGSTVSALTVSGTTATWSGTGRWDGVDGCTFTVRVADNRDGGSRKGTSADTFAIEVRDGAGALLFSASGPLSGGNLTVHD